MTGLQNYVTSSVCKIILSTHIVPHEGVKSAISRGVLPVAKSKVPSIKGNVVFVIQVLLKMMDVYCTLCCTQTNIVLGFFYDSRNNDLHHYDNRHNNNNHLFEVEIANELYLRFFFFSSFFNIQKAVNSFEQEFCGRLCCNCKQLFSLEYSTCLYCFLILVGW